MLVLVDPWPRLLPVMSPLAPLAMGSSVGHMGSSTVRIQYVSRTFSNFMCHTVYSRNEPSARVKIEYLWDPGADNTKIHFQNKQKHFQKVQGTVIIYIFTRADIELLTLGSHFNNLSL